MDDTNPTEAFDPTRRKLCADGTCIGVIGDDGRCGECGRTEAQAEAGEARLKDGAEVVDSDDAHGGSQLGDVGAISDVGIEDAGLGAAASTGFDPTTRRLCDDGSCVGVVGDDGVCRVCGRRSE
jgi:hypothetical protein